MNTKMKIIPAAIAAALFAFTLSSCKKDNDNNTVTDLTADAKIAYDNSVAESSFEQAGVAADEGFRIGSGTTQASSSFMNGQTSACLTVTIDTLSNPKTLTLDFGTSHCLGNDGNYRKGKIIVSWNGSYNLPGHLHTITFDDYYLNFNKIEGTKTVENKGYNASGNLWFEITVNGTVTIDPQYSFNGTGGTITYTSNRIREWIAGSASPQGNDDVYLISGTASGTTTTGASYSMNTQNGSPLRLEIGFPHFVSGILNITPSGKPVRTIDYSYLNNARDNLALLTVNGMTRTITLGRRGL